MVGRRPSLLLVRHPDPTQGSNLPPSKPRRKGLSTGFSLPIVPLRCPFFQAMGNPGGSGRRRTQTVLRPGRDRTTPWHPRAIHTRIRHGLAPRGPFPSTQEPLRSTLLGPRMSRATIVGDSSRLSPPSALPRIQFQASNQARRVHGATLPREMNPFVFACTCWSFRLSWHRLHVSMDVEPSISSDVGRQRRQDRRRAFFAGERKDAHVRKRPLFRREADRRRGHPPVVGDVAPSSSKGIDDSTAKLREVDPRLERKEGTFAHRPSWSSWIALFRARKKPRRGWEEDAWIETDGKQTLRERAFALWPALVYQHHKGSADLHAFPGATCQSRTILDAIFRREGSSLAFVPLNRRGKGP